MLSNVGDGGTGARLRPRHDVLAQRPLHEELPEDVGDTSRVPARVVADRLDRGVEENVVVRVPPEETVGERDQSDRLVVRAVREVRVERDAKGPKRLLVENLVPDELTQPPRRRAVLRRDRPFGVPPGILHVGAAAGTSLVSGRHGPRSLT